MSDATPRRPSRWWYLAGVLVWIGGCAGTLGVGLSAMTDQVEAMPRVVVPGEHAIELDAGEYTGFYEPESFVDGAYYHTADAVSGVRCGIVDAAGQPVPIKPASSSATYEVGSYTGTPMFVFESPAAGTYRFHCQYDGEPIVIAFGQGIGATIIIVVAAAFGFFVLGAALIIFAFVKRRAT